MTNMKATHDQLMDMLADADLDCRKLDAQNKELKALVLEHTRLGIELNEEIKRLQAIIDEDRKIS